MFHPRKTNNPPKTQLLEFTQNKNPPNQNLTHIYPKQTIHPPSKVSGYLSRVCLHVSKTLPLRFRRILASVLTGVLKVGAAGMDCFEMGTQPMAVARTKGNQADTEAMEDDVLRVCCLLGAVCW